MTGNDALEYITNLLLVSTTIGRNSGKSYTLKAIYKLSEELELLEKYKRAFEILKRELSLEIKGYENIDVYNILLTWSDRVFIKKEEYELLEELMNN